MTFKRTAALIIGAIMVLSLGLVGCGSDQKPASTDTAPPDATTTDPAAPDATAAKYVILDEALSSEHYGIGFKLGNETLRDAVEYTLVQLYNDGTVATIAQKYAAQGINIDSYILTSTAVAAAPALDITTFTVGFDQEFPPYGYVGDDGNFTGFDLDLAAEVAARNGWEVKYVPINWDAKDLELSSGNIDCIWNGFTIEGREGEYTWTKPYMDNSQVVVVRADSGITSFDDLADKIVMAQADSAALTVLTDDLPELSSTFKELRTIPDYNTAFLELEMGSVDAVAIDLPVATYQINSHS